MKDVTYLHNLYNATSTDDENGDIETYVHWLEKQLLRRIEEIEQINTFRKLNGWDANLPPI